MRQALKRLGIRRRKASEPVLPGLEPEGPEVSPTQPTGTETETAPEPPHDHVPADSSAPVPATDSDPSDRSGDRALAAAGALHDAPPLFGDADSVPGAGVLLAVPAIVESGVLDSFRKTHGTLGPAFHGLRTMVMTMLFMLLLRIRRPGHLRHGRPVDLGRALGLDRVAEVKTVRRKLGILAGRKRGHELFARLIGAGWDVITYRKGRVDKLPEDAFERVATKVDGREFSYLAHECGVRIGNAAVRGPDGTERPLWMRQITRLKDDGKQTQALTSRADLAPAEVLVRMFDRWRQENVFKYMRREFALDDLFSYRV